MNKFKILMWVFCNHYNMEIIQEFIASFFFLWLSSDLKTRKLNKISCDNLR